MSPTATLTVARLAEMNLHSSLIQFLQTHECEDLLPFVMEHMTLGDRFSDFRASVEGYDFSNRQPGKQYCWRCGRVVTSSDAGYSCDECGHIEVRA